MSTTTIEDVATALEILASRVPDRHVSPDAAMAATWHVDLVRWNRAAIFRAAREWTGPRFPSVTQLVEAVQVSARAIMAEERAALGDGTIELVVCPHGCASGWVEVDGLNTVRPCERCRPVGHATWRHRSTAGHDDRTCPDCSLLRSKSSAAPVWLTEARARRDRGPGIERAVSDDGF